MEGKRLFLVGIGGTTRTGSATERAMAISLAAARGLGAETMTFDGRTLQLPMYAPERPERTAEACALVEAIRRADGVIIASPGYHGSVSGLVKNALDYLEDLRNDVRPYLDGRAVGCIVCAFGWQATGTTLVALRSIVHALRGWPTPLGVTVNSAEVTFDVDAGCSDEVVANQLRLLGEQVVRFATVMRRGADSALAG